MKRFGLMTLVVMSFAVTSVMAAENCTPSEGTEAAKAQSTDKAKPQRTDKNPDGTAIDLMETK